MDDIEHDLEEFANYILEAIKQSEGEISNWDEIIRKWKEIEKKKDLALRKKLKWALFNEFFETKYQSIFLKGAVTHIVRVDAKVTKDSEVQGGKKDSRCNSCDEKKEIVFEKEGFRLCNECLDEFMKQHRFTK